MSNTNEWRRDSSGALINNDVDSYVLYKQKKKATKEQTKKMQELEQRVEYLEEKLDVVFRKLKD